MILPAFGYLGRACDAERLGSGDARRLSDQAADRLLTALGRQLPGP
jgi:hypothetical protein